MSQQQLVNCVMNLNQLFTNLYELKFKGRKMVEELINTLFELELLQKHQKKHTEKIIFQTAISNCHLALGQILAKFEEELLQRYHAAVDKVKLNTNYLQDLAQKKQYTNPMNPYQLLLLEIVQLGLDIGQSYQNQCQLIRSQWAQESSEIVRLGKEPEGLKELMLHIGFETFIEEGLQESWRLKLAALSNQRYNPKKI